MRINGLYPGSHDMKVGNDLQKYSRSVSLNCNRYTDEVKITEGLGKDQCAPSSKCEF